MDHLDGLVERRRVRLANHQLEQNVEEVEHREVRFLVVDLLVQLFALLFRDLERIVAVVLLGALRLEDVFETLLLVVGNDEALLVKCERIGSTRGDRRNILAGEEIVGEVDLDAAAISFPEERDEVVVLILDLAGVLETEKKVLKLLVFDVREKQDFANTILVKTKRDALALVGFLVDDIVLELDRLLRHDEPKDIDSVKDLARRANEVLERILSNATEDRIEREVLLCNEHVAKQLIDKREVRRLRLLVFLLLQGGWVGSCHRCSLPSEKWTPATAPTWRRCIGRVKCVRITGKPDRSGRSENKSSIVSRPI